MAYECLEVSRDGGVAHLRLNHPERLNAMTRAFWLELPRAIGQLDAEGGTRVAVISSTGKHFTAGMDLSVFEGNDALVTDTPAGRERFRQQLLVLQETFSSIARARFPVIAAVQGGCIGGGMDLVSACCLRYCTREAFFTIHEINIGMMADVGTLQRAPRQLPEAVAGIGQLAHDRLGAERAERLGFVNGLFDTHEALLEGVMGVAKRIAAKSPVAVAASKDVISYSRDHAVAESFAYMNALQPGIFSIADIGRAVAAQKSGVAAQFDDLPPIRPPIR